MGMRATASRMRILCPCPEVPTLHAGRGAGGARGVVAAGFVSKILHFTFYT